MANILLWPFKLIWHLLAAILNLTGRLVAILIGLMLVLVGVSLSATILGAIVGIAMIVFGAALILRGLF